MWTQSPFAQKGRSPQFLAHVYCGQTAAWSKMPLGTKVGVGIRGIVLDGNPSPPPLKGHSPQFSATVRCGQTAGWTRMPLGMEVGLGPGDFVFDGDPASQKKGHSPTQYFGPCLLWPNSWMDQDATWYGGKPRPRQRCVRWGRNPPPSKRGTVPQFRSMSIVAKWLNR